MIQGFFNLVKSYKVVICVLVVLFMVLQFVIQISIVPSESMEPTIKSGRIIVGSRLATPKIGDIIIFETKNVRFVKRIIACGGQTVEIKNGTYYIDGKKDKLKNTYPDKETKFAVPRGCFFVSGDNRENSFDSRHWKEPFIKKSEVESIVIYKGW